jgi:hypothetical protein
MVKLERGLKLLNPDRLLPATANLVGRALEAKMKNADELKRDGDGSLMPSEIRAVELRRNELGPMFRPYFGDFSRQGAKSQSLEEKDENSYE